MSQALNAIIIGVIMILIPLLVSGSLFALAICKIPKNYALGKTGWIFFYSILIALGIAVLLFWNGPEPKILLRMFR